MRMAWTLGLVALCFGCGGGSSNSSKKPSAESLAGAWRQSPQDSSATSSSPSSQHKQGKLPKMLQASGSVSSADGMYLFVNATQVNLMTEAGASSPCELDRGWALSGRLITLEDKSGCNDVQARVEKLTSSQLTLSAEGQEGSQAVFTRITEDDLDTLTREFSLSGAGIPQALQNYLAGREQPDERAEADQSAAMDVKALMIHRELAAGGQPQSGLLDGKIRRLTQAPEEPSPSVFLQDGKVKAWDVDLDQALCTLILPQGKVTVPAGQIEIRQARHQEMQIEGKGTRVGIVMEVDPAHVEAAHLESVICFGGPQASRFTWQDFRKAVGSYISVIR